MFGFSKKISLSDSGFLKGITDWHSHLLPGVDDGIEDIEDSLKVLSHLEQLGVRKIWLTPHIMEDYPNETTTLKEIFKSLKDKWTGKLEIALGSENMLDYLFEERLEKNDFLPLGEAGNFLLVETSYFNKPYGMKEMMKRAAGKGYDIILAHPERYNYMDEAEYRKHKEDGIKFQLNYMSLIGAYGEVVRKKAEWLLKNGYVDFFGSDIHRLDNMELISKGKIQSKISKLLREY